MKKFFAIIVLFALCLCMWGCTSETAAPEPKKVQNKIYEVVATQGEVSIVREKTTDVLYLLYNAYYEGGITVMYNVDGTPLLYSEWLEMQQTQNGN